MNHAVRGQDAMLRGLLREAVSGLGQLYSLGDEVVGRARAELSFEMAETAFGGVVSFAEAKALAVVGVERIGEIAQRLGAIPGVENSPREEEKHGDGMERDLSFGGRGIDLVSQRPFQGAEIDETKGEVEGGEDQPEGLVGKKVLVAKIDVLGKVVSLGRRGSAGGNGQSKGKKSQEGWEREFGDE
ncbi:MAG: hypothetical protein Q7O66_20270 [Dehalococcoidia bacterium]|nr:hypothetical protein [Dehalococcoidia bacterium]